MLGRNWSRDDRLGSKDSHGGPRGSGSLGSLSKSLHHWLISHGNRVHKSGVFPNVFHKPAVQVDTRRACINIHQTQHWRGGLFFLGNLKTQGMDYICNHGFTWGNYSPNSLHMTPRAMLHCLCYPFVLRISAEEPKKTEATQGWLYVIPLSHLWPYLHILWPLTGRFVTQCCR